jgi:hypothetical protein
MFEHSQRFPGVLPAYRDERSDDLIAALSDYVITPAEVKGAEMRYRRPSNRADHDKLD